MNREIYWGTICWNGYDEYTEGEYTITRYSLNNLLEDVEYYMDYFKGRYPYVECASREIDHIETDITILVQEFIKNKTEEINGK